MKVLKMEVGMLGTNCYIAINEATNHGVVVDPGGDGDRIVAAVKKEGVTIDAIFITHGHSDHRCVRLPVPRSMSARKMLRC